MPARFSAMNKGEDKPYAYTHRGKRVAGFIQPESGTCTCDGQRI
jgi:hypothetical protein